MKGVRKAADALSRRPVCRRFFDPDGTSGCGIDIDLPAVGCQHFLLKLVELRKNIVLFFFQSVIFGQLIAFPIVLNIGAVQIVQSGNDFLLEQGRVGKSQLVTCKPLLPAVAVEGLHDQLGIPCRGKDTGKRHQECDGF